MRIMYVLRRARWLGWVLAWSTLVPYLATGVLAAQGERPSQTVVLFPLAMSGSGSRSEIAAELTTFVSKGVANSRQYIVIEYNDRLPAVQRLIQMQPEKKSATVGPFSDDPASIEKAAMLANAMSADLFVVGTVEYSFSERDSVAQVIASLQIMDAKTGKIVDTVGVTGRATKPSDTAVVGETAVASEAVKDAGRKIVKAITGKDYKEPLAAMEPVTPSVRNKNSKKGWLPLLLLSLGVGLLLGGSGGGGDDGGSAPGGGIDTPPPPPSGW
ncbi:MAG: hypothetical protein ACPL7O_06870 [Armatimonadota bacterium]